MKFSFILLLSLLNSNAFAQAEICDDDNPGVKDILAISKHIEWEAASIANIKSAPCTRKTPFTNDEMLKWINTHQSPVKESKKIHGIQFADETEENLKAFEYLTTAKTFLGESDPKKQKIFKSACKKVECAVKEIFGKDVGVQLLFMQQKFGMNGSNIARENADLWKKSELDTVLLALSDYPEGIMPVEESRTLVHFKRGYMRNGGDRTLANAVIEIFDLWDRQSPEEKRYTLNHEVGHVIGGLCKIDDHPKWRNLSGWVSSTKVVDGEKETVMRATKPETIVSKYGFTNTHEDFAESVAAYRYNPALLKKASPEKYNIIKQVVFDNVEYTSEAACKNPSRFSAQLKAKADAAAKNWVPTQSDLTNIGKKCSEEAVVQLSKAGVVNLSSPSIQKCYEKAIYAQAKSIALSTMNDHPLKQFLGTMIRNMKLAPLSPQKISQISASATKVHKENLKKIFVKGLSSQTYRGTNPSKTDFQYVNQSFDENQIGFNTFNRKPEFIQIAVNSFKQMKQQSSLRRFLDLDFSESEVEDQVDRMIK